MGLFVGTGMVAWYPDPYRYDIKNTVVPKALDLRYVLRGLRTPTLWGGLACATFSLAECVMESVRSDAAHESTYVNAAFGGAAAGIVMGSLTRRFDIMAATALGTGLVMGMMEFNGHFVAQKAANRPANPLAKIQAEQTSEPPTGPSPGTVAGLKQVYPEYKNL